jgi:hypothetical protein
MNEFHAGEYMVIRLTREKGLIHLKWSSKVEEMTIHVPLFDWIT